MRGTIFRKRRGWGGLQGLESRLLMSAVDPVINEFMASNTAGIFDDENIRSDWIEIYNPGSLPVNLQGWHLTDEQNVPHKFTFPSTIINPGGYLLVFATGTERAIAGQELHAGFRLNGDGEYLALLRPDDTPTTVFDSFPAQLANISYGFAAGSTSFSTPLTTGAGAAYLIPSDGALNTTWTDPDFNSSFWTPATTGVGFYPAPAGSNPLARETEPNGSTAAANSAASNFAPSLGNLYQLGITGVASVNASVINDDWFKVGRLQPGDILTIAGAGSPSSRIGGSTNLSVELWRAGATIAVIADSDGGPGADALINRFGITIADTYYIRIKPQTTAVLTANYELGAWLENSGPNPIATSTGTSETEANDTLATANDVSANWRAVNYLSRTSGAITSGDTDFYQYSLTAGDVLTVNIDSTSTLDARVSLLRSDGVVIASEDGSSAGAGTDSSIYSYVVPTSGTYYVQVSSSAATTGAYNADVYLSSSSTPPAPTSFSSLISTNIEPQMRNTRASAYLRIPFNIADPSSVGSLLLRMRYNDGFVAYLNGFRVAERNAPAAPAFDSAATASRSAAESSIVETIDISAFKSALLEPGPNILAIHGLNSSAADGDFLVLPELLAGNFTPGAIQHMTTSTPGRANVAGALGVVEDTSFSADRGFYDQPFQLTITSDTTDAQIRYTLDGSPPTATTGFVYSGPFTVGPQLYGGGPAKPGVITVRAAAFKTGWISTNVDTQTYIFLDQVITQDDAGLPATWGASGATLKNPPGPDYAFDQNVINANLATIKDDLKSLPTVNLTMPLSDWFGTTLNPGLGIYPAGIGVPKAMSMEYFNGTGTESFQVNGSVNIIGGGEGGTSAQRWKSYKLSMRLKFKEVFGDPNLEFPLYGPDAGDEFDTLILDAQINNTWVHPGVNQQNNAMLIQDQFVADLQSAMSGGPGHGPQGKFVHLYLNGLYWGVYDLHERPDEHFAVEYYGGEEADWDVLSHTRANPSNGEATATANFDLMLNRVRADMSAPGNFELVEQVLDIDDFIDYMLANIFAGNNDWSHKNWYATYNRVDPNGKWRFHSWDAEHVFHTGQGGALNPNVDITGDNDINSPTQMHQLLSVSPEYRMRFADRMHQHFFNGGALTAESTAAMYQARISEVEGAMFAESARWGDNRRTPGNSYTQTTWRLYQNRLLTEYFPARSNNVLTQLQNRGLYPVVGAPVFSPNGGTFAGATSLTITGPGGSGTIYYTTDGSDPRLPGGALNPAAIAYSGTISIAQSANVRARVLDGTTWSALQQARFIIGPPPALRITEVMYHPRDAALGSPYLADDFEYIELQNTGGGTINLSGIQFTKGITFAFAPGTTLAPGARTLIVHNQAAFESRYGLGLSISGVYAGALSDSGENIRLETGLGQEIEEFRYNDGWYPQSDGEGFSLVAVNPSATNLALSEKEGWRPSEPMDGGPGVADPGMAPGSIVINEIQSRPSNPNSDWIELRNTTNAAIDISGWGLSDSASNLTKYIIQPGTTIPANDYLVFNELTSFGLAGNPGVNVQFDFSRFQDQAYISQRIGGALAGYRDSVDFGGADVDIPFGRYIKSTGAKDFVPMSAPTRGAANAYPRVGPIVINEVMYQPHFTGREYIELKNISGSDVSLYDAALAAPWRFTNGINYTFANGNIIPAGGYALIVPTTPAVFRSTYNIPASVQIFGPYTGQLNNGGEQVELGKPGGLDGTGAQTWIMVDRLTYNNLAPWPAASGNGASLSRKLFKNYTNDVANWTASSAGGTPGAANPFMLAGTASSDSYYLRLGTGGTGQLYRNDPTFSQPPEFSFALDDLDQLMIDAAGGNDSIWIDLATGIPLPAWGLIFNGGAGGADSLRVTGNGGAGSYTPSKTTSGSGTVIAGGKSIAFSGLEPVNVSTFATFTFTTPNAADNITITSPGAGQNTISGSSGGIGFESLTISNLATLILDLSANDAGAGNDAINFSSPMAVGSNLDLNVGTGTNTLTLPVSRSINALTIGPTGRLNLAPGGRALKVNNLSLATDATLDLADNDLIVQATSSTWQAVLDSVTALVAAARNHGSSLWLAPGITSSTAAANPLRNTGLATIVARTASGEPLIPGGFNSHLVDENSIIVKYTYNGDATLHGTVNADDYALIDAGYAARLSGYRNGDFDYSGTIDADDYFLIDKAFSTQGSALAAPPAQQAASSTTTTTTRTVSKKRKIHRKDRHHRRHPRPNLNPRLTLNQLFYRRV